MPDETLVAADSFYWPLHDADSPARRVGWESEEAHRVRLGACVEALGPLGDVDSVLDVGCGEGALCGVLREAGFTGRYRGEDLLPHMIEAAQAAFPDSEFAVHDAFLPGPDADAVVACGTFNTGPSRAHDEAVVRALETLWERTRRVLVVALAEAGAGPAGAQLRTADGSDVWRHARRLAPVVVLRADSVPGDLLLVMQRDRRDRLTALLDGEQHALARARIHLAAGETGAARQALGAEGSPEARLTRAVIHASSGRARDAERELRALADHAVIGSRARLHLAAVLQATRRWAEARALLADLARGQTTVADEARLYLGRLLLSDGNRPAASRHLEAIVDPWIRREADALDLELPR